MAGCHLQDLARMDVEQQSSRGVRDLLRGSRRGTATPGAARERARTAARLLGRVAGRQQAAATHAPQDVPRAARATRCQVGAFPAVTV